MRPSLRIALAAAALVIAGCGEAERHAATPSDSTVAASAGSNDSTGALRPIDGVRLVLVSTDFEEQANDVRRFLAKHGVRDTTYLKHDGDQPFIDTINPEWSGTIPATLVYDAAGRRIAFWEGRADRARFESAIQQALGAASSNTKGTPS